MMSPNEATQMLNGSNLTYVQLSHECDIYTALVFKV